MTLIYAHRGSSGAHPENTLLAFREALAAGVDGIELDVHATADRIPVVIHDREVARTTDGDGHIDEMTLAQAKLLNAGSGQRVSTLAEVIELVDGAVHLDIEIKGHGIERSVLVVLDDYPRERWAISSFAWDTLREVRRLDARTELWPLAEEVSDELLATAGALGSPVIALSATAYKLETARRLRDARLEAMIWTVNDVSEARRVQRLGARAICTDFPDRIRAALRSE